ncbi:uncharacterized protein PHALS_12406 [Plasmopara halstedii]|uniref:Uncharacterized protein n=1 Tax=Plasmopara halstedii TaxID=4781 RepID=A0A0P1ALB4_PLAHL|nr:uncharacterized protein PHALS_12406 [Plasmopara halstedii]CEG42102.1 hypothetical protein PHALS_12406 [Plasmopara halstedii]|eukprot:XP_024578471.1 hypothetical protein PHALS_12406 [Plasmopara halstedii]
MGSARACALFQAHESGHQQKNLTFAFVGWLNLNGNLPLLPKSIKNLIDVVL